MRKTTFASAASALVIGQALAFSATPAFAADGPPEAGELQAVCQSLLQPNANSGFTTSVSGQTTSQSSNTVSTETGRDYVGESFGGFEYADPYLQVSGNQKKIFADQVATEVS
jgi:hypothetical protein